MLDPDALAMLQQHAHATLQQLTEEVCTEAGVDPANVYEVVVTGNATMIQIALGIDPEPLSMAPFTMAARKLPAASAQDFGITVHERAPAVLFPALGAYVGPDIVAGVPATGLPLPPSLLGFLHGGPHPAVVPGSIPAAAPAAPPARP